MYLSLIHIYANCSNPLSCALNVSTEATNASLSLQIPFQTASIAGTLVKGDLLLDDDMETALTYTPAVGIGTGMVLCVKLGRTVDKSQQLGLALDSKTFALGAGVGSWITVSTYLDGQATGEEFSDWNTVGLDVIGSVSYTHLDVYKRQSSYKSMRILLDL